MSPANQRFVFESALSRNNYLSVIKNLAYTMLFLVGVVVAMSVAVAPTYSFAITFRQLCTDLMPKNSMTDPGNYSCEDQIEQNAGNCTIGGKMNTAQDEPSLGTYRKYHNVTGTTGRYRAYD